MCMQSVKYILSSSAGGTCLPQKTEVIKQAIHRPMQVSEINIADTTEHRDVMSVESLPILHKNPGETNTVVELF